MNVCGACGAEFPNRVVIDGLVRNLHGRTFCLDCSPFGAHNTSKTPPGALAPAELNEYRRRRRNAKTIRYQKRHRREVKSRLIAAHGGRCVDCGYAGALAALDFHHRDSGTKEFAISSFRGSWAKLVAEVEKCDLLCANCHRIRHLIEDRALQVGAVAASRRRTKIRAVAYMGGSCESCGRRGEPAIFDFHHVVPSQKEFGIGQDGIPRRWSAVVAELAKCVLLCANCHREVHAGVRELDEGLLGLAEDTVAYAA